MEDVQKSDPIRQSVRDSLPPIEAPKKGRTPTREENAQLAKAGQYVALFQQNFWFFWKIVGKRADKCHMSFEDLFQEVFLNFMTKAHNWDPDQSAFTTYFHKSAWHWMGRYIHYWCAGKKHHTAKHATFESVSFDALADTTEDQQVNLMRDVIASDSREMLFKAIRRLTPKHQFVIISRFFVYKTLEQVGEELGITREAVRQRQVKALKLLSAFSDVQQLGGLEKTPQLAYENPPESILRDSELQTS